MSSQQAMGNNAESGHCAEPGTRGCDQCLWAVPWAGKPLLVPGCGGCHPPDAVGWEVQSEVVQCPGSVCTWGCQETVSGMFPVCELVVVFVACDLCHAEFGWKLGFGSKCTQTTS